MSPTIMDLAQRCGTEQDAWLLLEEWRWPVEVSCARCGSTEVHPIAATEDRVPRVWRCRKGDGGCGRPFKATTGTVMQGTRVAISTWLFVAFEMRASKNGIAARDIRRKYKLDWHTSRRLLHKIRDQMTEDQNR